MVKSFSRASILGLALSLALPTLGNAQDIFLASGGADLTWKGTATGANAGTWMDIGSVSTDTRRDLIVGAPGTSGTSGTVYVIFGGPTRTGDLSLSSADTVITSSAAGNRFGAATAVGNIRNAEGTALKNLVVGAPGALSNRGEVYVFTAGYASGASLSTSSAVFKIQGATGDQIGSALATGDLDGDTFREIIIGAPGNSRVYVIKGGPSLSGTLDLSGGLPSCAAAADVNCAIQAPGIGRNLIAGDVTGDSIYDLLIGAPSNNVVYLFPGVSGMLPPAATTSFSGTDAGDEAGTSIRILDIDADGKNDLAIGAPGGDGPADGRVNAGEVYVFLGPVTTPGARSLASAPIVFYGAAVNYRAGDTVATGDINRDTPNDLVINESGGSGGAGVLDIYYGRSRSTIGTVQGTQRVVDFSVTGQANRRIFGDAATGPIGAVQVFEVTGEGARDIIVGVPAFDSNTGKLYFTISPKLRISPATVSLTVNQGGTVISSTPINVTNPSVVTTGWTAAFPTDAPVDERWVAATPSAGTVDSTHPNSFNVVASSCRSQSGGPYGHARGDIDESGSDDDASGGCHADRHRCDRRDRCAGGWRNGQQRLHDRRLGDRPCGPDRHRCELGAGIRVPVERRADLPRNRDLRRVPPGRRCDLWLAVHSVRLLPQRQQPDPRIELPDLRVCEEHRHQCVRELPLDQRERLELEPGPVARPARSESDTAAKPEQSRDGRLRHSDPDRQHAGRRQQDGALLRDNEQRGNEDGRAARNGHVLRRVRDVVGHDERDVDRSELGIRHRRRQLHRRGEGRFVCRRHGAERHHHRHGTGCDQLAADDPGAAARPRVAEQPDRLLRYSGEQRRGLSDRLASPGGRSTTSP